MPVASRLAFARREFGLISVARMRQLHRKKPVKVGLSASCSGQAMLSRMRKWWHAGAAPRRQLFLHEDQWGEIEVLPAACAQWCAAELARIAAFADAHCAPDGIGWTDIYMRKPPPQTLGDLRIAFDVAVRTLAERLPPFDTVASGTFSAPEVVPRVRAFGPAPRTGVVLVPAKNADIVEMISLVLDGAADACAEVTRVVAALPAPSPLVLVDWRVGLLVAL